MKKRNNVGTVSKSNRKIIERDKIDTSNTNTQPLTFMPSIKSGGIKPV